MEASTLIRRVHMDCPLCDKTHEVEERKRFTTITLKGDKVTYEERFYYCANADEEENEFEEIVYSAYTDKTKNNLISKYYNYDCIFSDSDIQEECYTNFRTYQIVLKKEKDNKYHFNEIIRII